jgi:hypothetical protein
VAGADQDGLATTRLADLCGPSAARVSVPAQVSVTALLLPVAAVTATGRTRPTALGTAFGRTPMPA